jgi:predicted enzyme related to lactoylglutathione lyase
MAANMRIVPTLPAIDIERAKKFYRDGFGCQIKQATPEPGAILECQGSELYIYQRGPSKADHTLAAFLVDDLESEMRVLRGKGIKFEEYDIPSMGLKTVNGVATLGGMKGAWFKDSEGNILGLTQLVKTGGSKEHGTPKETVASR